MDWTDLEALFYLKPVYDYNNDLFQSSGSRSDDRHGSPNKTRRETGNGIWHHWSSNSNNVKFPIYFKLFSKNIVKNVRNQLCNVNSLNESKVFENFWQEHL